MFSKFDRHFVNATPYEVNQRKRVEESVLVSKQFNIINGTVLNVAGGEWGALNKIWQESFPQSQFIGTNFRLPGKFPYPDNHFDCALLCEVFEHIGDDSFSSSTNNFSGIIQTLSELTRVIKHGARVLITTPNVNSTLNIMLILNHTHPFMYPLHYREYSRHEIEKILSIVGVDIISFESKNVFTYSKERYDIEAMLKQHGYRDDDRGDDYFIVYEKGINFKPSTIPNRVALSVYPDMKRENFRKHNSEVLSRSHPEKCLGDLVQPSPPEILTHSGTHSDRTETLTLEMAFDTQFYLKNNPDVAQSGIAPLTHYMEFGFREGRNPAPWFDAQYYLATYPDVAMCGMNPLVHFLTYGRRENRKPNDSSLSTPTESLG